MTGKELKELVSNIPDDAIVQVAGPDGGGYDYTYHSYAVVDGPYPELSVNYFLKGVERDGTREA